MTRLRVVLTISGGVSFGAYERGVVAAVLNAIGPLCSGDDPPVRLDAIGGASAGAMTGLPGARWITAGLDRVYVMKGAWVSGHALSGLLKARQEAPLSSQVLREQAHRHR